MSSGQKFGYIIAITFFLCGGGAFIGVGTHLCMQRNTIINNQLSTTETVAEQFTNYYPCSDTYCYGSSISAFYPYCTALSPTYAPIGNTISCFNQQTFQTCNYTIGTCIDVVYDKHFKAGDNLISQYLHTAYWPTSCTFNSNTCLNSTIVPLDTIYYDKTDWSDWRISPFDTSDKYSNCIVLETFGSLYIVSGIISLIFLFKTSCKS
jgi:hypothetical protein